METNSQTKPKTSKFNPEDHMIDLKGKKYLPVAWRIVWFREEHPDGAIITEFINFNPLLCRATVVTENGVTLGTGHAGAVAKPNAVWAGREFEKAETAAQGRALGVAGYGTQFDADDEEDYLADSPIEVTAKIQPSSTAPATNGNGNGKSQTDAHDWTAAEIAAMDGYCRAWFNVEKSRPFTGEDALVALRKAAWGEIHDGVEAAQGLVRGYAIRQCLPMIVSKCQYHNQGHGGYVALSNGQYTARLYGYDNKSGRETLSAFGAIWEAAMGKLTNGQGCELPGELLVHWRTSGDYNTATKVEVLMSENIPF